MESSGEAAVSQAQRKVQPTGQRSFKQLLRDNVLKIVDNPLLHRDADDLKRDVEDFRKLHKLQDIVEEELLLRGAQLAQDPDVFIRPGNLSAIERDALVREENPKLRELSKELQVILLTCCLGAIVQGWSQANLSGANLLWPNDFHINRKLADNAKPDWGGVWKFAAVNGVTYYAAGFLRGALFVSGFLSLGASIGSAFTDSWETLFVCRLLQGIGMGAKASVVPIFESEVSPPEMRGRLLVSWQTFTAFGIFLGSGVNLIVHKYWRLQIGSAFIPVVPFLCLIFVCSESPRWLIKKNKYVEAYKVLCRLRDTPLQAARDLYMIHAQIQVETILFSDREDVETALREWTKNANSDMYQKEVEKTNYLKRFTQLFSIARNRRASLAACIAMISQQFSGINIFAFLAASFFSDYGYTDIQSLWFAFGFAAANAIFSPIAYFYVDSKGRRFLLLLSLVIMFPLLLATGFSFNIEEGYRQNQRRDGAIGFFLLLYTAAYSPGAGVIPFLYSSEVFPLVNREVGMSLSCAANFIIAGVVAMTVPPLTWKIKHTKVLGIFAGLDAGAAIAVWLLLPGTPEGTTLEEMNYIFGVKTRDHIIYQVDTVLPWITNHYIPGLMGRYWPWASEGLKRKSIPPLYPLYTWEKGRRQQEQGNVVHGTSAAPPPPPAPPQQQQYSRRAEAMTEDIEMTHRRTQDYNRT